MQTAPPRQTLAVRKATGAQRGKWEFPGGKQESGETLRACLEREIKEELGLDILAGHYVGLSDYRNGSLHLALHGFIVRQWSGDLLLSEHDAARWLAADELLSLSWCPADIPLVEMVLQNHL